MTEGVHQLITDQIVAAIEAGAGAFKMPWHRASGPSLRPINVASGRSYQGVNVLSLWMAAESHKYGAPLWGTYRQWLAKGANVRRGEKASIVVFYQEREFSRVNDETGESEEGRALIARASNVFNVAQVDNFVDEARPGPERRDPIDPIGEADLLIARTGAEIREGGDQAYYAPGPDYIAVPDRALFAGTDTMSATESYYSLKLHELLHWTGHRSRLARDFSGRFGSESYAFEELIAGIGEAYLCADLGVVTALRPDHAAYVAHWLHILKDDRRAIFTAASQAQRAADYLLSFVRPHGSRVEGREDCAGEPPDR